MKSIYRLLPPEWTQRIRRVIEFDSGVTDTHLLRASKDVDPLSGFGNPFRPAPGSFPQARIPTGPIDRIYNIQYYSRDTRRNAVSQEIPIEASFNAEGRAQLQAPVLIDAPKQGSPGNKNPDVERYDKSGLRSAMTATHAALQRELAKCRPAAHVPTPVWKKEKATLDWVKARPGTEGMPGRPTTKRLSPWQYTQFNQW